MSLPERLRAVYKALLRAHGPQGWWPGGGPFEVIAGAILTQAAAWTNVEAALSNLRRADALSPEGIRRLEVDELARLLYPAGYYNAKARKLKAFVGLLDGRFGGDIEAFLAASTEELRPLLIATHGIGPETADAILLYACGRPAFVIDAYTRRLFGRLGLAPARDSYEGWQALFHANLAADAATFNEYHALIVRHGKDVCRRQPLCGECALRDVCETGLATLGVASAMMRAG